MNNNRTVSDTKRAFYSLHSRPINSIYRRVVEEIMVEMHLLMVNVDYRYDPIYALGVVTTFDRFMQGYVPETDKASIFNALCEAVENNPQQFQNDASRLTQLADRVSAQDLVSWLDLSVSLPDANDLQETIRAIAGNVKFKYSRLFAIGLFTLLEQADPDLVKDSQWRNETLQNICRVLNLPWEKLNKDLDLYRSNLEKMAQARSALADVLQADRKKREQREQAIAGAGDSPSNPNQ